MLSYIIILSTAFETFLGFTLFWSLHLALTVGAWAAWYFGRRRVRWYRWEYTIVIVPYWLLVYLLVIVDMKGNVNLILEPLILAPLISLLPVIRILLYRRQSIRIALVCYYAGLIFALALWLFFPAIHVNTN